MKTSINTIEWIVDPGHAWLSVPLESLPEPLACYISEYSYKDESRAYLEEDCDAGRWIKYHNIPQSSIASILARNYDTDAPVRMLKRFTD